MSLLGEAVEVVCRPWRVNYEIFGNTAPFLHAHVLPRYDWEPAEYLAGPASHYPRERRHDPRHQFSEEAHGQLQVQIAATLRALLTRAAS
jgi:diadenosine tetraphosphate (Ap4A) HIT family hydrolase